MRLIAANTIVATLLLSAPLAAQEAPAKPDSATVEAGKKLFEGVGICASCHGMEGEGLLGPATILNANKKEWLHQDGSWAGLTKMILLGIDGDHSESGQVMPPKGGSRLTDKQVSQVAAYVMKLHTSHPK